METQPWTETEIKQLEDPDQWDPDGAVTVEPSAKSGAVVAVRFSTTEFEAVARAADRHDQNLTQFIRETVLAKARFGKTKPTAGSEQPPKPH